MDGGVGTTPMTLRCQHTSQKGNKSETRMTASVLKQDPNT